MYLVSAPAKVILFGEHSVVYGKPAIASSVNLRTFAIIYATPSLRFFLPDMDLDCSWDSDDLSPPAHVSGPSKQALLAFLALHAHLGLNLRFTLIIRSDIPIGSGLGSSASLSSCMSAAIILLAGKSLDLDFVNSCAFLAEKVIHGNPSGLDNFITTFGGSTIYKKNQSPGSLHGLNDIDFLLIDSKVPKNTMVQVQKVASKLQILPKLMNCIIDGMGLLVEEAIDLFQNNANGKMAKLVFYDLLENLIDTNHHLLNACSVGHHSLEQIRNVLDQFGIKSKLTGAGGGGCTLALIRPDQPSVKTAIEKLESLGFKCYQTTLGVRGVLVQPVDQEFVESFTRIDIGTLYKID